MTEFGPRVQVETRHEPRHDPGHGRGRDTTDDAGFSLIELMVAMSIFTIFIALILGTTIALAQAASRTQSIGQASNSTLAVFSTMDRQARYADSINFPGVAFDGNRYVEFRTPATSTASGEVMCTQWRFLVGEGRIESRQWADVTGATATAWSTRVTNVIDDGANYPFTLIPAEGLSGSSMQRFVVTVHAGNASMDAGSTMSTTFVARNSSIASPSNTDSVQPGVSNNPVCLTSGDRS